jgi:Fur family ferric uptake transcriptional regulator
VARAKEPSARAKGTPPVEQLRSTLRDAGLRVTAPRVSVFRALYEAKGPISHPELADQLAVEGWDRATIYRNLIDLTEVGLVRRTDLGDHVWRFELMRGETEDHDKTMHAHFVCDSCGDVQCLPGEAIKVVPVRGMPKSMRKAEGMEIQLRGRCDNCD